MFCSLLAKCRIPCACHAKRHLNVQKCSKPLSFSTFDFEMCFAPQRRALFRHLNFQKWVRTWCVLYILTWKRASRHNGVHFFDISTSKRGLRMVRFVHFDLEMCFAPQRRALFRHLNVQKSSDVGVLCAF